MYRNIVLFFIVSFVAGQVTAGINNKGKKNIPGFISKKSADKKISKASSVVSNSSGSPGVKECPVEVVPKGSSGTIDRRFPLNEIFGLVADTENETYPIQIGPVNFSEEPASFEVLVPTHLSICSDFSFKTTPISDEKIALSVVNNFQFEKHIDSAFIKDINEKYDTSFSEDVKLLSEQEKYELCLAKRIPATGGQVVLTKNKLGYLDIDIQKYPKYIEGTNYSHKASKIELSDKFSPTKPLEVVFGSPISWGRRSGGLFGAGKVDYQKCMYSESLSDEGPVYAHTPEEANIEALVDACKKGSLDKFVEVANSLGNKDALGSIIDEIYMMKAKERVKEIYEEIDEIYEDLALDAEGDFKSDISNKMVDKKIDKYLELASEANEVFIQKAVTRLEEIKEELDKDKISEKEILALETERDELQELIEGLSSGGKNEEKLYMAMKKANELDDRAIRIATLSYTSRGFSKFPSDDGDDEITKDEVVERIVEEVKDFKTDQLEEWKALQGASTGDPKPYQDEQKKYNKLRKSLNSRLNAIAKKDQREYKAACSPKGGVSVQIFGYSNFDRQKCARYMSTVRHRESMKQKLVGKYQKQLFDSHNRMMRLYDATIEGQRGIAADEFEGMYSDMDYSMYDSQFLGPRMPSSHNYQYNMGNYANGFTGMQANPQVYSPYAPGYMPNQYYGASFPQLQAPGMIQPPVPYAYPQF